MESGQVSLREVPLPNRDSRFALVRMLRAGICNTDLELQRGYYNFSGIPGHEFVGEVLECASPELLGKRVVGEINLACGGCQFCATGLSRHCARRVVLGILNHPGAFAEFLALPESNLRLVPDEISDQTAVFVEPLAAACEILEQLHIPVGERVAVLGDGKLGLLTAQVLQVHGARVTLFGRHHSKLEIARSFGIETEAASVRPTSEFNIVVECTGSPEALPEAIGMVKPRGTVVMKSTVRAPVVIDTVPVIVNEISLVGSRCGRFEPALELLRSGQVNVSPLIVGDFPLSEAPTAFAAAATKGALKILIHNT
jgi:2-desacetyl-2-hydroxyethyl bacteriochlorophyllide A dehydrogenase